MLLKANQGGCCCGAGDYLIDSYKLIGGAIMSAKKVLHDDDEENDDMAYKIFVYTDKVPKGGELLSVTGNDGSGYYGTGYEIEFYEPVENTDS